MLRIRVICARGVWDHVCDPFAPQSDCNRAPLYALSVRIAMPTARRAGCDPWNRASCQS